MSVNQDATVVELLRIVGSEDRTDDGASGAITVEGALANAIVATVFDLESARQRFIGMPVQVSRLGHLEIWCDGWYMEGAGVRRIVHAAVRALS